MKHLLKPESYLDSYGKRIFQSLVAICEGYSIEIDPISASIMAQQLSIIQRASKEMNKKGISQDGKTFDRQTPAVKTFHEASSKFLSYASEFGITPQARKRLFREIEKLELSDALDRLVEDNSHEEFESEPGDTAMKQTARTLKKLRDGTSG